MEKEFIPYEQALELKELGFDEACIMQWTHLPELIFCTTAWSHPTFKTNKESELDSKGDCISAPTYSQAFRWFRDNGKVAEIFSQLLPSNKFKWGFKIQGVEGIIDGFFTYEEAELACLKKLIEIVKNERS
jgi:hypothetical protein